MNKILVSKEGLLGVRVDLSDFCLPRRFCIFDSAGVACRFGDACLQKRDTQLRVRESCSLSSTLCRKDHGRRILFAPPCQLLLLELRSASGFVAVREVELRYDLLKL